MQEKEYFTKIAQQVKEGRKKSEYTQKEREIYDEGRKDAYKDVLYLCMHAHTRGNKKKAKQLSGIFENKFRYGQVELQKFVQIEVNYFEMTIKKLRKEIVGLQTMLRHFQQLTID